MNEKTKKALVQRNTENFTECPTGSQHKWQSARSCTVFNFEVPVNARDV